MRLASVPIAFLTMVCVGACAAQANPSAPPTLVNTPSACPVELSAEQGHDGALMSLASSGAPGQPVHAQQVIHLTIRNSQPGRIVSAEVEVHGTSPRGRLLPLQSASFQETVADAVRRVHLDASVAADQTATHRVNAGQLTSVQWLNVVELRYADGSQWHASGGQQCRVEPNPLLRVASDRDDFAAK